MGLAEMACAWCCSPSKGSVQLLRWFWMVLAHFLVALPSCGCGGRGVFGRGTALRRAVGTDRQAVPQLVFQVSTCPTTLLLMVNMYLYIVRLSIGSPGQIFWTDRFEKNCSAY